VIVGGLPPLASPSPTITAPSEEIPVALLEEPPERNPKPDKPCCTVQRNAWRLPAVVALVPATTIPSADRALAWLDAYPERMPTFRNVARGVGDPLSLLLQPGRLAANGNAQRISRAYFQHNSNNSPLPFLHTFPPPQLHA
jgi:hypothetical protein